MKNDKGLWISVTIVASIVGCLLGYSVFFYKHPPSAYVERIDKNGTVWIKLSNMNVSENTTIYVYYGDNVSSKQMWILK